MKNDGNILKNPIITYLTIIIYPLWTLFISFKYFRMPHSKNLFWLFCIFLGTIHIYFPEGRDDADGFRYAKRLTELYQEPVSFANFTSSFYEDGEFIDFYQPVITYFLSTVTKNPRWLFLIFAIVYGFFYSRNCWFVLSKFPKYIGFPLFFLTLYFILICPIWNINGVRMWTAFHVFAYGALHYLYNSDKSKSIWCLISLLIHFSFIIPLIILVIYHFFPKSLRLFLAIYLISLFIKEINIEPIKNILLSYTPALLSNKLTSYTNESYIQQVIEAKSNLNFYVEGSKTVVDVIISIFFFVLCVWGKTMVNNNIKILNLVCFSLFIYSICNILSTIPSIQRFFLLCQLFSLVSIILFYITFKQYRFKNKVIILIFKVLPVLLLFPVLVILRQGCEFYGISLFFNPVASLFISDNQPLIQLIKSII